MDLGLRKILKGKKYFTVHFLLCARQNILKIIIFGLFEVWKGVKNTLSCAGIKRMAEQTFVVRTF
jgi:hypothetical protein